MARGKQAQRLVPTGTTGQTFYSRNEGGSWQSVGLRLPQILWLETARA